MNHTWCTIITSWSFWVTFWSFWHQIWRLLGPLSQNGSSWGAKGTETKNRARHADPQSRFRTPLFSCLSTNFMKMCSRKRLETIVFVLASFQGLGDLKNEALHRHFRAKPWERCSKTHFVKKRRCHGKGSLWGSPGNAFRRYFGASWETNGGKWRLTKTQLFVCVFWVPNWGRESVRTKQVFRGVVPLINLKHWFLKTVKYWLLN